MHRDQDGRHTSPEPAVTVRGSTSMAEVLLTFLSALTNAFSAFDALVTLTRSHTDVQRKLAMYPAELAAFKSKACAVKLVLEKTPPAKRGSALPIAQSTLSAAVIKALVCPLCPVCTMQSLTQVQGQTKHDNRVPAGAA